MEALCLAERPQGFYLALNCLLDGNRIQTKSCDVHTHTPLGPGSQAHQGPRLFQSDASCGNRNAGEKPAVECLAGGFHHKEMSDVSMPQQHMCVCVSVRTKYVSVCVCVCDVI